MNISLITPIPDICLLTDISRIVFACPSERCRIVVSADGREVLSEVYYPDNNGQVVLVDMDRLLRSYMDSALTCECSITANYPESPAEVERVFRLVYCEADIQIPAGEFMCGNFLTLLKSKNTSAGYCEFLSMYVDKPEGVYATRLDTGESRLIATFGEPQVGTIRTINVSCGELGFEGCGRYEIKAGGRLMHYNVVTTSREPAPRLIFRNSFGCEETIYCLGTHKLEGDYTRTNAYIDGDFSNIGIEEVKKFSASTGILPVEMANWADELFRSRSVCLFTMAADGRTVVRGKKITVTDSKSERSNDDDALPSFTFSYRYAQRNHNIFDGIVEGKIFDNTFDGSFA